MGGTNLFFHNMSLNRHLKIKETLNQIYIAPHPLLSNFIAHYTVSFPDTNEISICKDSVNDLTLIPDSSGCIIYTFENNDFSSILWGATTKTVKVKNDVNLISIRFFIEFMPGGLYAVTGIKQSELCDLKVPVDEVHKDLAYFLRIAMEKTNNLDDFISMVNIILLKEVEKNNKQCEVIDSALHRIKAANGRLTIKELSAEEYISERQLNRLFNEHIGINAKLFSRLLRVNHSINIFNKIDYKSSINTAQILGYFDQSHFIRDFKEICGVSPNIYFKNMSDFYNEPFKY